MPNFSGKSPVRWSFCFSVLALLLAATSNLLGQSTTLVISQLYGAGGNSGATLNADYVELFNLGTTTVSLDGYSLQYAAATSGNSGAGTATVLPIPTGFSLKPGQYILFQATPSATVGAALNPPADATIATIAFGGSAGKVFLTNNATAVAYGSDGCPTSANTNIVDFVAYGTTANCGEGGVGKFAPAPSATTADIRTPVCTDTNNNSTDFVAGTPAPHNQASTLTPCGASTPTGPSVSNVTFSPASVAIGSTSTLTAKVTKGTSTTISTVTADLSNVGGSSTQTLYDDGTHGDATANDGTYSYTLTAGGTAGTYTITVKATDAGSLTGSGTGSLTTTAPVGTTNPTLTNGTATPNPVTSGSTVLLTAKYTAGANPTSTTPVVTADLSAFGGSTTQALYDDGTHGDATSADGTYSYLLTVPSGQTAQSYTVNVKVTDSQVRTGTGTILFSVQAPVAAAATVSVSSSTSSAVVGSSVTLTATVAGNKSSSPSGTVTFYDNGTSLGQGSALTNGSSFLATTALALGSHTITASYSGDSVYPSVAATSSTSTTVNITAAPVKDFSLTASNTNIILNDDQKTGTVSIAVDFLNGFNSTVALSCSGLPAGSRCAFSPASLTATGNSIMTIAVDGASLAPHSKPFGKKDETVLAFLMLALPFAARRKVRARLGKIGTVLGLLVLGAAVMSATGCSGGTTTPASTSTITVTGTGGGVTHTTTFTLTAQ